MMSYTTGLPLWAQLPDELLFAISNYFDFRIDLLRFRSVCTSWRSSVPSPNFEQQQHNPPLSVMFPFSVNGHGGVLSPFSIYRMQFQPPTDGSWLVKIEESDCGRIRLVNPITNIKLRYSKIELSSLDFHLLHLSDSYRLRYACGFAAFEVNKVALFPYASQLTVIAIYHQGKLGFWRKGDEDWTLLDNSNFDYDDLIPYGDLFYVVDRSGAVSWINSSLEVIRSQIPPRGGGGQKNLVESEGDLYMIDRYLDGRRRNWKDVEDAIDRFPDQIRYLVGTRRSRRWNPSAVDFKVYKMEKELGIWVDVESWIGDRAFVLTNECSFSFKNVGRKSGGNWIYYSDNDDYVARSMMTPESVRVFQYQDRTIHQLCGSSSSSPVDLDIFRTPPALNLPASS